MTRKVGLLAVAFTLVLLALSFAPESTARADQWGRYYHWPYQQFHQQYWTPYEYQPIYDQGYRYPAFQRVYPNRYGWRNWLTVRKPYYRGHHFILDRF